MADAFFIFIRNDLKINLRLKFFLITQSLHARLSLALQNKIAASFFPRRMHCKKQTALLSQHRMFSTRYFAAASTPTRIVGTSAIFGLLLSSDYHHLFHLLSRTDTQTIQIHAALKCRRIERDIVRAAAECSINKR